jgi:hypothetical protein
MAKKNYDLLFKLLLIGDSGVGKVSEKKRNNRSKSIVFLRFRLVFYFDSLMIHLMLHLFPQSVLILKSRQSNSMDER